MWGWKTCNIHNWHNALEILFGYSLWDLWNFLNLFECEWYHYFVFSACLHTYHSSSLSPFGDAIINGAESWENNMQNDRPIKPPLPCHTAILLVINDMQQRWLRSLRRGQEPDWKWRSVLFPQNQLGLMGTASLVPSSATPDILERLTRG